METSLRQRQAFASIKVSMSLVGVWWSKEKSQQQLVGPTHGMTIQRSYMRQHCHCHCLCLSTSTHNSCLLFVGFWKDDSATSQSWGGDVTQISRKQYLEPLTSGVACWTDSRRTRPCQLDKNYSHHRKKPLQRKCFLEIQL